MAFCLAAMQLGFVSSDQFTFTEEVDRGLEDVNADNDDTDHERDAASVESDADDADTFRFKSAVSSGAFMQSGDSMSMRKGKGGSKKKSKSKKKAPKSSKKSSSSKKGSAKKGIISKYSWNCRSSRSALTKMSSNWRPFAL